MSKPAVALMGLGIMGSGMAKNLLRAGFPLAVYNRSREKAERLAAEGARVTASPREAAEGAEFVISMVADDAASRGVWLGDQGAMASAAPGAVLIESSTVTPDWIRELAEEARTRGFELLDAPVTGTRPHAEAGQLLFLVGGTDAALEKARPVLTVMAREIQHIGPTGSGALMKLINNFLCGVQAAALAEAVGLIEKSGLDRKQALEILTKGAPGSPLVQTLAGRMVGQDYAPANFPLQLMLKDLTYAAREGEHHGVPLRTTTGAREVFEQGVQGGHGSEDFAAIVEQFR